ncbi:hypothetical protein EDB84DRAFT_118857 [Lactarius hengduanensis]|nr:hypothetical protein EDB84DRAFT_118857 [Lactarius hengduanensis]
MRCLTGTITYLDRDISRSIFKLLGRLTYCNVSRLELKEDQTFYVRNAPPRVPGGPQIDGTRKEGVEVARDTQNITIEYLIVRRTTRSSAQIFSPTWYSKFSRTDSLAGPGNVPPRWTISTSAFPDSPGACRSEIKGGTSWRGMDEERRGMSGVWSCARADSKL